MRNELFKQGRRMTDIVSEQQRSYIMSRVGSKNTKPELVVRSYLHRRGFRYRIHGEKLPGRPDLVFAKHKTVVFVHGCFWHRHDGCSRATMPSTRVEFWRNKFERNMARDQANQTELRKLGWRVVVLWECEIGTIAARDESLERLAATIAKP
jgi:DNA mismatch endonuclease (patch repair protein)|tara:strand:+ start:252 stop:707 length:456 start_codon:yes stop_codon:yes gene_type:complete